MVPLHESEPAEKAEMTCAAKTSVEMRSEEEGPMAVVASLAKAEGKPLPESPVEEIAGATPGTGAAAGSEIIISEAGAAAEPKSALERLALKETVTVLAAKEEPVVEGTMVVAVDALALAPGTATALEVKEGPVDDLGVERKAEKRPLTEASVVATAEVTQGAEVSAGPRAEEKWAEKRPSAEVSVGATAEMTQGAKASAELRAEEKEGLTEVAALASAEEQPTTMVTKEELTGEATGVVETGFPTLAQRTSDASAALLARARAAEDLCHAKGPSPRKTRSKSAKVKNTARATPSLEWR